MREDGKLDEAVAEFQKALAIDPSLFIAQQELTRTLKMINDQKNPPPQAADLPTAFSAACAKLPVQSNSLPSRMSPSPSRCSLRQSDVVYRTVGQLAGINVLFDPDYTPRVINVDLNGVTLEEALQITALESKTFWRPVTPNTIFVAHR